MGVLDAVITDVGTQLRINSASAGSVLSGLLSFINEDGMSAFLDRFRQAGVANLVTSWLSGDARSVSTDAVESVLGHDRINTIASNAGLSSFTTASAIALMVPRLVQRIAPGGAIPSRLSSELMSYLSAPSAAIASGARQAAAAVGSVAEGGMSRYLWLVIALVAIGLLIAWVAIRGG